MKVLVSRNEGNSLNVNALNLRSHYDGAKSNKPFTLCVTTEEAMIESIANKLAEVKEVRYIKLGEGGKWEKECFEGGIMRIGLDGATDERFQLCEAGAWDELKKSFRQRGKNVGTATRFTNETKIFFQDTGHILWITFSAAKFYWCFLSQEPAERHESGDGAYRKVSDKWKSEDIRGECLTTENLSGGLTKLAAYRGTSCSVKLKDYVLRRVKGEKSIEAVKAAEISARMKDAILGLITNLDPSDFEILVDLIFTGSGWRRLGSVGGLQKGIDIQMILPSTEEKAVIQVKSDTDTAKLNTWLKTVTSEWPDHRLFFVYHSGNPRSEHARLKLIGPTKLAELAFDAGLTHWLIQKVS